MKRRGLVLVLALLVAFLVVAVLAPAVLAYRMDVPVWKQSDSRWAGLHLGSSSYTMSGSGCAVTSCAMVASYFGSSKDPGGLCKALNSSGGFSSSGAVYWQNVPAAAGGTISYVGRWDSCSLTRINQELDAGYPVIVQVSRGGSTHFVVLTGRDGSTYYLNDPAYGDRTTLNSRYGTPSAAIKGFRVYRGTHAASPPPSPYTRIEQGSSLLAYTGSWTVSSSPSASGSSFRFVNTAGASVTATFKGTYLAWIAKRSPVYGVASVTLDGGSPVLVDLHSSGAGWQKTVWKTGTLVSGMHTVTIRWTGGRNGSATDTNVGVDAFDILGTLTQASAPPSEPALTRYEQTHSLLAYSDNWLTFTASGASGGTYLYADSRAAATISFEGTRLDWIATKGLNQGRASVSVDGGDPVIVDLYRSAVLRRVPVWSTGALAGGAHTIVVTWLGKASVAGGGTRVNIDALDVRGVLTQASG